AQARHARRVDGGPLSRRRKARRGGLRLRLPVLRARAVLRPRCPRRAPRAPGLTGERRALVAGVVLGEDEGLAAELQDRFRSSGLYHLLAVSGQNVVYVMGGALLLAWVLGLPRFAGEAGAIAAVV